MRDSDETDQSIPAMSPLPFDAFAPVTAPLGSARAARVKAWRGHLEPQMESGFHGIYLVYTCGWRTCPTWALARNALSQHLPMPTATLGAML